MRVTFCEEGVDWNLWYYGRFFTGIWSPSVRKVWIEIYYHSVFWPIKFVTFCEEGVDWNKSRCGLLCKRVASPSVRKVWIEILCPATQRWCTGSPSVRKVWIEIPLTRASTVGCSVTFCEDGVDWNASKLFQPFCQVVPFCDDHMSWNNHLPPSNLSSQQKEPSESKCF